MNNLTGILVIAFLTFFFVKEKPKKLPNGHYKVVLDKQYTELGLNNYEFTLEDKKFIYIINNETENLEIFWVDENSFIVKGLTEPLNPDEIVKEIIKNTKIYFRITKQEKNKYFFKLGEEFDKYPIYSGKFVKIK